MTVGVLPGAQPPIRASESNPSAPFQLAQGIIFGYRSAPPKTGPERPSMPTDNSDDVKRLSVVLRDEDTTRISNIRYMLDKQANGKLHSITDVVREALKRLNDDLIKQNLKPAP